MDVEVLKKTTDFQTYVTNINQKKPPPKTPDVKKNFNKNHAPFEAKANSLQRNGKKKGSKDNTSSRDFLGWDSAYQSTLHLSDNSELQLDRLPVRKLSAVKGTQFPRLSESTPNLQHTQLHQGTSRPVTGAPSHNYASDDTSVPSRETNDVDSFGYLLATPQKDKSSSIHQNFLVSPPLTASNNTGKVRWGAGFHAVRPELKVEVQTPIRDRSGEINRWPRGLPNLKALQKTTPTHDNAGIHAMPSQDYTTTTRYLQGQLSNPLFATPLPDAPAPPITDDVDEVEGIEPNSRPDAIPFESFWQEEGILNNSLTDERSPRSVVFAIPSVEETAFEEHSVKSSSVHLGSTGRPPPDGKISQFQLTERPFFDHPVFSSTNPKARDRRWASGFNPKQRPATVPNSPGINPSKSSDGFNFSNTMGGTAPSLNTTKPQKQKRNKARSDKGLPSRLAATTPNPHEYLKSGTDVHMRRSLPAGKKSTIRSAYVSLNGLSDHDGEDTAPETDEIPAESKDKLPAELEECKFFLKTAVELYKQKRLYEAIEACNRVLCHDPHSVTGLVVRAHCYNGIKKFNEAIEDTIVAIQLKENYEQAYLAKAEAHISLQQWDLAIKDATKALIYNPSCATAYHHRAVCYVAKLKWDNALKDVEKVLETRPRALAARTLRTEIHRALNEWVKVVADCNVLMELRGEHRASTACRRAEAYIRLGHFDKAIEDCTKCIQLNPEISQAYAYRGEAFFQLGLHKHAVSDFEMYRSLKALAYGQDYPPPMRVWRHLWREW